MSTDPIRRFRRWQSEARKGGVQLPEAMALATVDASGRPRVRFVLLKGADQDGFTFYTNFESKKGRELLANPNASLAFYWDEIGKQVRVDGKVRAVSAAEADAYWEERPPASRIASAISQQSRPVDARSTLLARYRELEKRYPAGDVPRPDRWSGFVLKPRSIEFWTRAEPRLHKRELFTATRDGWRTQLLQP